MFQAMISDVDFDLKQVWKICLDNDVNAYACVPGSLKQRVEYGSCFQIGSLHIKTVMPNLSLLLFSNGKIKCSGSYKTYANQDKVDSFIMEMVAPICDLVRIKFDRENFKICLLNAGFSLHMMNEMRYFKICNEIQSYYDVVMMPKSMMGVRQKGRFCALKIYVHGKHPGPSLHFDHKGKVQAFAFKSVEDIAYEVTKLCDIVEVINKQ